LATLDVKQASVAAHHEFIAGPENRATLELLKDDYITDSISLWHLSPDAFGSPSSQVLLSAPVISLNRHFVPPSKKVEFEKKFAEVKGILEEYTKPYPVVGAWRAEKERLEGKELECEEWDVFSGFESVEHHMEFAKMEGFEKYREIVRFVEGFEVKHLKGIAGL
jgi:hypothetical protein